jgi:hypothetical protein
MIDRLQAECDSWCAKAERLEVALHNAQTRIKQLEGSLAVAMQAEYDSADRITPDELRCAGM